MTPISKLQFYVKASLGQYFFLVWSRSLSHTNQLGEKSVKVLKFYSEQPFVFEMAVVRSWPQADNQSLVNSGKRYLWQAINHLSGAQVVTLPTKLSREVGITVSIYYHQIIMMTICKSTYQWARAQIYMLTVGMTRWE